MVSDENGRPRQLEHLPGLQRIIDDLAVEFFGRAPRPGQCVNCGKEVEVEDFRDQFSIREYQISGFCQECQDALFTDPDLEGQDED